MISTGNGRPNVPLRREKRCEPNSGSNKDPRLWFKALVELPWVINHPAVKALYIDHELFYFLALQLTYPGTRLSTLEELFAFGACVDPERKLQWNIESKINPVQTNSTRGVDDFVTAQHKAFLKSPYKLSQITVSGLLFSSKFVNSEGMYSIKVLIGGLLWQ